MIKFKKNILFLIIGLSTIRPMCGATDCGGMPEGIPQISLDPHFEKLTLFQSQYFEMSLQVWGAISYNCNSTPALPAGLSLDSIFCKISGTPLNAQPTINYLITASNAKGSSSASVTLRVANSTAINVWGQGGSFSSNASNNGSISANSLNAPHGATVDSTGGVYIADSLNNRVLYYPTASTSANRVYGQMGSFTSSISNNGGISADSLSNPVDVAIDINDDLYISDSGNNRVLFYSSGSTTATRVYGQLGSFTSNSQNNGGVSATSLSGPSGISVVSNGTSSSIYIADVNNNRVLYFDMQNTTASLVYGQSGNFGSNLSNNGGINANSLNSPFDVAAAPDGGVYISDSFNNRVLYYPAGSTTATKVFGQSGNFSSNIPNNGGVSADSLNMPFGISSENFGGIYIVDSLNNRVLYFNNTNTSASYIFGQNGNFSSNIINNGGITANSLSGALNVTVDSTGGLFIIDTGNNRLLYY